MVNPRDLAGNAKEGEEKEEEVEEVRGSVPVSGVLEAHALLHDQRGGVGREHGAQVREFPGKLIVFACVLVLWLV